MTGFFFREGVAISEEGVDVEEATPALPEPTKAESPAKSRMTELQAGKLDKRIMDTVGTVRDAMARLLPIDMKRMRDEEGWRHLTYTSWEDYCTSRLRMSKRWANKLIAREVSGDWAELPETTGTESNPAVAQVGTPFPEPPAKREESDTPTRAALPPPHRESDDEEPVESAVPSPSDSDEGKAETNPHQETVSNPPSSAAMAPSDTVEPGASRRLLFTMVELPAPLVKSLEAKAPEGYEPAAAVGWLLDQIESLEAEVHKLKVELAEARRNPRPKDEPPTFKAPVPKESKPPPVEPPVAGVATMDLTESGQRSGRTEQQIRASIHACSYQGRHKQPKPCPGRCGWKGSWEATLEGAR